MVEHFLAAFHQLEGTSVGEKRKSLFKLLEQKPWTRDEIEAIVKGLAPKTPLEKIFHVEALIFFRHFDALYRVFTGGEGILASKISKQAWFFDRIFDNVSPKEFVQRTLPTLSLAVRLKLAKKLRASEETCDEIFENLTKKYGLFFASHILDRCSASKIEAVIKSHPVKLSVGQLKIIYQKSAPLIRLYLDEIKKVEGADEQVLEKYSSLFVWIAEQDADDYCDLQKKYKIKVKLGKRVSKHIVGLKKDEILTEPRDYMRTLKSSVAVRQLGRDFKQVYLTLSKDEKYHEYEREQLFQKYAKNGRYALYKSVHDQITQKKLDENNLDAITDSFLSIIQDPAERQKWAKLKYDKDENEEYLRYYRAEDCFDILTAKLNSAPRTQRFSYVEIMLDSCKRNENVDVLLKVAKLIAGRLKNDDTSVHLKIMDALEDSKITDRFVEAHWKVLEEIFAILEVQNEINWQTKKMQHKYLKFLFENGKPINEFVLKYKIDDDESCHCHYIPADCGKYQKAYIIAAIETAPERFSEKEKLEVFDCALTDVVITHNKKYPSEMIDVYRYTRLIESAKSFLEKQCLAYWRNSFAYIAGCCYKGQSEIDKDYLHMYFSKYDAVGGKETVLWYLKYNPTVIQEHYDEILKTLINKQDRYHLRGLEKIWKSVRNYSHLELDEKTVKCCMEKLSDKEFSKQIFLVVKILALLMPPAEYKALAATYKSSVKHYNASKIHALLLKNFRSLRLPENVLPAVVESCISEDVLSGCLPPMYSSICRAPQDRALHYIEQLHKSKALSVKKHALFLTVETQDKNTVAQAFKNVSFPSLLYVLLKYLAKNPNQELWELFQSRILQVPENDVQLFESLLKLNLPLCYKARVFELLWTIIDKYQSKKLKRAFVDRLEKADIITMGLELCKNVIHDSFFKPIESEIPIDKSPELFTANFLLFHEDPGKFDVVFDVLRKKKEQIESYKKIDKGSFQERRIRKMIRALVKSVYEIYMKTSDASEGFAEQFVAKFNELFTPTDAFEEYVLVNMMELKDKKDAAEIISAWNRRLIETYGEFILGIFAETMREAIEHMFEEEADRIKFSYDLLEKKEHVEDALLVIRLLPRSMPKSLDSAKYFNDSIAVLRQVPDKIVKLQLNFYIDPDNSPVVKHPNYAF